MVLWMTGAISYYTGPVSADLWRRYLDFMLDGMLAASMTPRDEVSSDRNACVTPYVRSRFTARSCSRTVAPHFGLPRTL